MATALTRPFTNSDFSVANKKFRIRDVAFTGNYQDDGSESSVTIAQLGCKRIHAAIVQAGIGAASNLATGNPVAATVSSTGTSVEFSFYEDLAAAAAAPLGEKTDNEAFLTGQSIRVLFITEG